MYIHVSNMTHWSHPERQYIRLFTFFNAYLSFEGTSVVFSMCIICLHDLHIILATCYFISSSAKEAEVQSVDKQIQMSNVNGHQVATATEIEDILAGNGFIYLYSRAHYLLLGANAKR